MAAKVTYDTDKRLIIVTEAPVDGVVNLDVQIDFYSDSKEDWQSVPALGKFEFPIDSVGGQPLPGSKTLGDTYFLKNPWKIRPYEADHKLAINGNLFSEDGTSVIVPTLGNFNVLVEMFVSNLSDSSIQQLTEIQYAAYNNGITIDAINGEDGTEYNYGTQVNPIKTLTVLDALRVNQKLPKRLYVASDLTIDGVIDLSEYEIIGESNVRTIITIQATPDMSKAVFMDAILIGELDGDNDIEECVLRDITYVNGHIHDSLLEGVITISGTKDLYMENCKQSNIDITPGVNMGGSGQDLIMTDYTGIINISNLTGANTAAIGLAGGKVVLESSVVAGIVHVSGDGRLEDESGNTIESGTWNGGVTIINELTPTAEQIADAVALATPGNPWNYSVNSVNTRPGTFGELVGVRMVNALRAIGKLLGRT